LEGRNLEGEVDRGYGEVIAVFVRFYLQTEYLDFRANHTKTYGQGRLPSSATCFNTLKLPLYATADEPDSKLRGTTSRLCTGH
jgi:hypothetical protein